MKKLFEKILIKQELLDRENNPVSGDITEEFNELPSNYVRTINSESSFYTYYVIRNTYQPWIIAKFFNNTDWFKSYDYSIVTNMKHFGEYIKFDTTYLFAIGAQIDLYLEILYGEY